MSKAVCPALYQCMCNVSKIIEVSKEQRKGKWIIYKKHFMYFEYNSLKIYKQQTVNNPAEDESITIWRGRVWLGDAPDSTCITTRGGYVNAIRGKKLVNP